jgi:hypothetical protein
VCPYICSVHLQGDAEQRPRSTILRPSDLKPASSKPAAPPSTKLRYVLAPQPTPWSQLLAERSPRFAGLQPGQRLEVSPEAWGAARRFAELIAGREAPVVAEDGARDAAAEEARLRSESLGGAALIIDYGDDKAFGNSFRAFKQHKIVDPLEDAGAADLTANVDFHHLKSAVATTDGA